MSGSSSDSSSEATVATLRDTVASATAEVLWRQWNAVGGSASTRARATALVDPESLVLMSLTLGPLEPRLDDLVSDWIALNADVLSVQRMHNLVSRYPAPTRARLTALARIALQEAKDHRWKPLLATDTVPIERRRNKRRAVRVPATESTALALRLRLAFGVGIKADLLAFLLCAHEAAATVAAIAAVTEYTPAAVRKAARDLAEAGFVRSVTHVGGDSALRYRTVRAMWSCLIAQTPRWVDWKARFIFVASFLDWTVEAQGRHLTEYVLESTLRDLIGQHAAAFVSQWPDLSYDPTDLPVPIVERFARAMVADA
jgi:hypothetical protein